MAIRLNIVIRELNIGLPTAVEFLRKKSELGEVEDNANFKLNDAQYAALREHFKGDKAIKDIADQLFPKKPKEKKKAPEAPKVEEVSIPKRPTGQPIGKIDLSGGSAKPKVEPVATTEPKEKEKAEETTPVAPVAETIKQPEEAKEPEMKKEPEAEVPAPKEQEPAKEPEPEQPEKASSPMRVTWCPPIKEGISTQFAFPEYFIIDTVPSDSTWISKSDSCVFLSPLTV